MTDTILQTPNPYFIFREPDLLEETNICWLNGEIDTNSHDYVIRFILGRHYRKEKRPDHIKLFINSEGGSVYDSFGIIDTMDLTDIPIWTYAIGQVCSGGLFIFMNGAPGKRFFMKNVTVMSHQWSGVAMGKEHEIKASEKENKLLSARVMRHYIKCTGLDKDIIKEKLLPPEDIYLSPRESIKYNLGDKIAVSL